MPGGLTEGISLLKLRLALLKFRVPNATARTYRANRPDATPGEILGALATDLLLRFLLNRLADARTDAPGATYVYEFGWRTPVQRLGACHALELGFVFDTLTHPHPGPDRPGRPAGAGGLAMDRAAGGGLRDGRGPGVAWPGTRDARCGSSPRTTWVPTGTVRRWSWPA
ncbi:hypothetical protein SBADM41S_07453 [Streptomyces badius]